VGAVVAPIHERNGRGHAFVDCETDEQFEALSRIWRGEVGYSFFEIPNSTFDEPSAVDRSTVDLTLARKSSRYSAVRGLRLRGLRLRERLAVPPT
jgi:hypothetical protein